MGSTAFQYDRTTVSVTNVGPWDLERLLDSVLVVGSGLDLQELLQRIVEVAVELVDARYGALGVLDDSGDRLAELITAGVDDCIHASIGDLPKGLGLLGSLITDGTPLRVDQLGEHPDSTGFPPNHPSMTTFLGVPIRVRGEVFAILYLTDKTTGEVFTDVDEELAVGLSVAAGVAIDNARLYEHGRLREAAMAAMEEVATMVLAGFDERSCLELIARLARELLTADIATIAGPDASGYELVVAVADNAAGEALRSERVVAAASPIDGDVHYTGHPAVVDNGSNQDCASSNQVQAGRIDRTLFVPLIVDGQPFASLRVSRAPPAAPFTLADLEVAQSFATKVGGVLQQDRARRQRQRMMLLEDQERIGRDLHDTVIQRLFATGLALQGAARLIADSDAQESIRSAVDELDRTIGHIRTVIFDVETSDRGRATGVRGQILELANDAGRGLGFQPCIVFTGPVDATLTGRLRTDLLATVQEVLSNVVRHAAASHVDLELSVDDAVALRVVDDGVGIAVESDYLQGHGMANMRARAERLGGTLDVSRPVSGGTEVRWRVPLLGCQS